MRSAAAGALAGWRALGEADWARLRPAAHPFESRAWLLATAPPAHAAVTVEEPGGALTGLTLLPDGAVRAPLHQPRDIFAGSRVLGLFEASGRRSRHHAAAAAADWSAFCSALSPYAYRAACRARGASPASISRLLEAALEACAAMGARGLALPYLREPEDTALVEAVLAMGGVATVLGAGCRLPIRWPSLAAYFAWLGASRSNVRRRFARSPGARRARVLAAGEALEPGIREPAVALLVTAAGRRGDDAPPRRLYDAVLSAWPSDRLVAWSEGEGGDVRACAVTFLQDGVVSCKWFADSAASGEYFQLGYAFIVERAIEAGLAAVDWGAGGHQAKLLRGGELYWITGALLSRDAGFLAGIRGWLDEYTHVAAGHLTELSARYGRFHQRPEVPVWA